MKKEIAWEDRTFWGKVIHFFRPMNTERCCSTCGNAYIYAPGLNHSCDPADVAKKVIRELVKEEYLK